MMRQLPRKLFPFFGFVFSFSFSTLWVRGDLESWDSVDMGWPLARPGFSFLFWRTSVLVIHLNCMVSGLYSFTGVIMVHLFQGYDEFHDVDIL
jgi:hypothetical protein